MLEKGILNKRICDCIKDSSNTETWLEFIRNSEKVFGLDSADVEKMSDEKLNSYVDFIDDLWSR